MLAEVVPWVGAGIHAVVFCKTGPVRNFVCGEARIS
jgi:hypothetical protein